MLYLDNNKVTELPAEIGHLMELRELSACNNQLVGLPTSIQKLNKLKGLYLNDNKLAELPAEIGDLKELRKLHVNSNPLNVDAIRCALKWEKTGMLVETDIAGEGRDIWIK